MAEDINGIEISDEFLDSIAGGRLDEVTKENLNGLVKGFSAAGLSNDEILERFAFARSSSDSEEIFDYIGKLLASRV